MFTAVTRGGSRISGTWFQGGASFVENLCYLYLVCIMLPRLFVAALWSPGGKGLASWLLFVMFIVILFETWYNIVSPVNGGEISIQINLHLFCAPHATPDKRKAISY